MLRANGIADLPGSGKPLNALNQIHGDEGVNSILEAVKNHSIFVFNVAPRRNREFRPHVS